jgi:hypothetical protein
MSLRTVNVGIKVIWSGLPSKTGRDNALLTVVVVPIASGELFLAYETQKEISQDPFSNVH